MSIERVPSAPFVVALAGWVVGVVVVVATPPVTALGHSVDAGATVVVSSTVVVAAASGRTATIGSALIARVPSAPLVVLVAFLVVVVVFAPLAGRGRRRRLRSWSSPACCSYGR